MSKITIGQALNGIDIKPEISWFSQAYKREITLTRLVVDRYFGKLKLLPTSSEQQ